MVKRKLVIYSLVIFLVGIACQDSVLNNKPLDKISESDVFTSAPLSDAALTKLYDDTRFKYFGGTWAYEYIKEMLLGGELRDRGNWYGEANWVDHQLMDDTREGIVGMWQYNHIRNLNEFIEKLSNANNVQGMDEDVKNHRLAEARFLRAFTYFEMVKRYGGVPLITETQRIPADGDYSDLMVERNSEKEVYDFVYDELVDIAGVLGGNGEVEVGRANKYVAWALASKAMLYAGSIAKYGEEQLNGLLGFPASEANDYYQKAYDAAKKVQEGGYALYNAESDKATNYQMLFLDEDNEEIIFSVKYNGLGNKGHGFSALFWPGGDSRVTWGAEGMVFLDVALMYDYTDGRKGTEDRAVLESNQLVDFNELWADKDPRFHASVLYPGAKFAGYPTYAHDGTYVNGELVTEQQVVGEYDGFDWLGISPWTRFHNRTGFTIKKFLNEPRGTQVTFGESEVDWIIFRYGEVLLNLAEAAYELGNTGEALDAINQVRSRAGMPNLNSLTLDDIIHERDVELMFEGHKYWDYRRWRIAEERLSESRSGVKVLFDWETKKYEVNVLDSQDRRERYFGPEHYYMPITVDRLSNNPNLAPENPGY
ncbi:RagB/SusD family nutrient uptake outer membrane protein [Rhodohalobacter sulfatireducens]|uniref:RagB/SusD family nutrient uptake outer membrane protein n=1 Tax=Rhodohalobacter sulfatireducens TaxID=2911366 RepID=A0ABS9KHW8_9BACT|nr:RagB/SusD family nutrient uptake outer membrane protein [Rhodohalobacter sulfatireducens]MCG2590448.1 RagB/SusD family nutrient uptake outer membrane protein [Rhodohalobacter sulfatireducens]